MIPAAKRVSAAALGVGLLLYWWIRHVAAMAPSEKTQLTFERVGVNWHLLWAQCLPWAMSYGVYVPGEKLYPDRWSVGGIDAVQIAAACLFGVLTLIGAVTIFLPRFPWKLRRLAAFGIASGVTSILLFLLSVMPLDMWARTGTSPRSSGAAPFALAPVTMLMTRRHLAMLFGPYVVCAGLGGWLSYGPYVHGIKPVVTALGAVRTSRSWCLPARQRRKEGGGEILARVSALVPVQRRADRVPARQSGRPLSAVSPAAGGRAGVHLPSVRAAAAAGASGPMAQSAWQELASIRSWQIHGHQSSTVKGSAGRVRRTLRDLLKSDPIARIGILVVAYNAESTLAQAC